MQPPELPYGAVLPRIKAFSLAQSGEEASDKRPFSARAMSYMVRQRLETAIARAENGRYSKEKLHGEHGGGTEDHGGKNLRVSATS